jgi:nucleotide-binding universal stress UspA family protein
LRKYRSFADNAATRSRGALYRRTAARKDRSACWNASREAARAAADALPFLKAAERAIVLAVNPTASVEGHGAELGADAAAWLSRHGVKVTVQRDVAPDSDVGGVFLSLAADRGADLIMMGIYGHSRMREMVLGGASRTVRQHHRPGLHGALDGGRRNANAWRPSPT